MNRTGGNVIARCNATAAAAMASAINHKSLFYEYSEPAAKITSVAGDRSAFPSFLHPYAVVLSLPYANAIASDTSRPSAFVRSSLQPRPRVRFPTVLAVTNGWTMMPSCLPPFYPSSLGSPAVKRSEEKWLVTIHSHLTCRTKRET